MINGYTEPLFLQHLCYCLRFAATHAIDDAAFTAMAINEIQYGFTLFFLLVSPFYGKTQVGTVERRDENLRLVEV